MGTGVSTEIGELAEQIKEICAADVTVINEAERGGDIKYSVADLQALEAALGCKPHTSVGQGLRELKKLDGRALNSQCCNPS